jgi:hypothetical protein
MVLRKGVENILITRKNVIHVFKVINYNVCFNLPMTSAMVAVELQVMKYV